MTPPYRLLVPKLSLLIISLCALINATAQTVDERFPVINNAGAIHDMAVSGSTLFVAGSFTSLGPPTGSFASTNRTTAAADLSWPKVEGDVHVVVPDGSGGWYIGGSISNIDGVIRNGAAHIKSDKTLDLAWDPDISGGAGIVYSIVLAPQGIILGGKFTTVGGTARNNIAMVDYLDGRARTWDANATGGTEVVNELVLSGNNTVYVGGNFTTIGGTARSNLAEVDLGTASATVGRQIRMEP